MIDPATAKPILRKDRIQRLGYTRMDPVRLMTAALKDRHPPGGAGQDSGHGMTVDIRKQHGMLATQA